MDCERLLSLMKRWGYRGVSYQYLMDAFGMTYEEAERCAKKAGIDLGYGFFSLRQRHARIKTAFLVICLPGRRVPTTETGGAGGSSTCCLQQPRHV